MIDDRDRSMKEIPSHSYNPTNSKGQFLAALKYLSEWVDWNEKFVGKGLDKVTFTQVAVVQNNLKIITEGMP
jgi:hypothetical protein